jgi:hypothetical protein
MSYLASAPEYRLYRPGQSEWMWVRVKEERLSGREL